ncbi:hypothetical protein GQ53DRAFT_755447 [Thozetella sp. PMI_491]|nr:hypothetical protein GQ53DRAFT_755447 [Thozetella sp. PMI_491]
MLVLHRWLPALPAELLLYCSGQPAWSKVQTTHANGVLYQPNFLVGGQVRAWFVRREGGKEKNKMGGGKGTGKMEPNRAHRDGRSCTATE